MFLISSYWFSLCDCERDVNHLQTVLIQTVTDFIRHDSHQYKMHAL